MHQPIATIFEKYTVFLLVRLGIPIVGILLFLTLATTKKTGQGWYIIGVLILLAEIRPTFRRGKHYLHSRRIIVRQDALWTNILRPVTRCIGLEDAWILSFCQWNNHRVHQAFHNNKATRALLLLPHCVQNIHCNADIIKELSQCHKCGLCAIGKILSLQTESACKIRIANRSYKAYKEVQKYQPDLIIAISCLDRSFKGLTNLSLTPSYVIPLKLNHGMCINTQFSTAELVKVIETLVE
jgi:hypothetical protein